VRLFADDTSLSYSSTNLLQIERKLNTDMNILNTSAETWLVKFNPQKKEFVIFNNNKNIYQANILFTGENIKQVEYHNHLDVCLSNCKWCYHINNTCQRATKRIHIYADLYRVNLKNDLHCVCGHSFEDAIHFFFLNVHFINTIELLCLVVLTALFPFL
jgi:hypothetical protein